MNIKLCDRCGKELGPADSYTVKFEAGEFATICDPCRLEYDLCKGCAKIMIEGITKGVSDKKETLRAMLNEGEKIAVKEQNTDWEKAAYEQKMKDMARLRPCKLCGGSAILQPWSESNGKETFSGESAGCPRCEIFVRGYGDTIMESREDAIERWNRKAGE